MSADADGYETTTPDAACAAAIDTLLMAVALESADHLEEQKSPRPKLAPQDRSYVKDMKRLMRLLARRMLSGAGMVRDSDLAGARERVTKWTKTALAAQHDHEATKQRVTEGAPYALLVLSTMLDGDATEALGASVRIERDQDGAGMVLRWKRLTPEAVHLEPLGMLLHCLHSLAQEAALTALERTACEWWFGLESEQSPERSLTRKWREREWSLLDRKCFATHETMFEMARATRHLKTLPPRAQRLAESVGKSRTGVFVVRERSGADVTLEDVGRHERVMMREHDRTRADEVGAVIVGRLYPYKDECYLRSPSAFVFDAALSRPPELLAEGTDLLVRERFPRAVALEVVVTQYILAPLLELPNKVPAAGSREEARRTLDALRAAMEDAGMFEHPLSEGALWLEPSGDKGRCTIFGFEADLPLAHWVESLLEVAGIAAEFRK
jgi:hypothetical protein